MYDIPLTYKGKRTICRKRKITRIPIANPENHFRTDYINTMVNEIKSNSQTQFESFAEYTDKFDFVFEVSNIKKY
jgi:hypothetical protein